MDYSRYIAKNVADIPPSGIRKFFDVVSTTKGAISLGVGEPDFVTPWNIRDAAIKSIQKGHTQYTSNWGLSELRNEIAKAYYDTIPKSERKGKVQITTSTSFFVPKPFTPFQWVRMATAEEFIDARKVLSGAIKEQ